MIQRLNNVRKISIQSFKMKDPPQKATGYYYNIYIHHDGEDMFPKEWAVGQGTDGYNHPFLTFAPPYHADVGYLDHEGFHVFQYMSNSPGFAYSGDSAWYIEATATWFDNYRNYKRNDLGFGCGAIEAIPHQALWHSNDNGAPGDPINWSTGVRQYAMSVLLFYMTEIAKISRSALIKGFYGNVSELPQEHLFRKTIGARKLRQIFADWASHNVNDFDYLRKAQVESSREEVTFYGDKTLFRPYAISSSINAVLNKRRAPPKKYRPRGWSYNTIKLNTNGNTGFYRVRINGISKGSERATSYFEARVVITGTRKTRFVKINMRRGLIGNIRVKLVNGDKMMFLVIAAVPSHVKGNQNYNYTFLITR
uniref:Peptidase M60 domain-containing protein n=1 Tax=Corethron hystrix TaxID=216773 RepID=A0A7S1BDQ9_9STRA|mmetsp:Transcript_23758/g.54151  ORF Transcript_23758/g.54151 Transcript_23758/m.54151 type:complete len:366 (+) Transcript_23758:767-1864(+)